MNRNKSAIVCGAGGFIGGHLVNRLKSEGYWVRGVDIKANEYNNNNSDDFVLGDLRDFNICKSLFDREIDEVYQLAADMGGAGYLFTGENDAAVMHNSALINLNMLEVSRLNNVKKIFYSSSACVYPEYNQMDPDNPKCSEDTVYPAAPDSEYGWEKLFSERLYLTYQKNCNISVKVGRFHNIFGPQGTWDGGKEKVPAAVCRKVAMAENGGEIEIWGDGKQTRSFLFIDECVEAVRRLMNSDFSGPVNIGSEEMLPINDLVKMVAEIAGKEITIKHITGPIGVRGRNSDNKLIMQKLDWEPSVPLRVGISKTYKWIEEQVLATKEKVSATEEMTL
ncbi:NAD-dependent epimerase/dehydratase family protein [Pararcticibacter amylolyticus]|uniref:NAD-dependent dehydratase n=1 Tax=Pararcticibacter amylolyticus TaxID=2173175 RepID=A0A2U2PBM4_9SPHI|nr:NAD-dependent epimerase/dehydratase family protein [Pararcticibacter amylolyticus]PWG78801.1 NAD-dependent dehydratase [Pararcticibacter amylolyticus]